MKLSELSKQIAQARSLATESLDDVPLAMRAGREAARNAASRELTNLQAEFRAAVTANSGYIVVKGGTKESVQYFSDIAVDEGNAIIINADELSYDIALALWRSMPNRSLDSNHTLFFGTAIGNVLATLGASSRVPLHIGGLVAQGRTYADVQALSDDLRAAIREAVGVELEIPYIRFTVGQKALEQGYEQNFVPVILLGVRDSDKELVEGLCGSDAVSVEVEAGKEEQQVKAAFKKLKEAAKSKRK